MTKVKSESATVEVAKPQDTQLVEYTWLGQNMIMGVPTRTLTFEEYDSFAQLIEACEAAMGVKIYEAVTEVI